ncbi:MAG TPA: HEAT repeat domain-containing protein [Candidatus Saccharimonadales bacterium]|nr:HEAT repeat domain-containing protein [Candidatus Saccharimonadales bacterium]
MNCDWVRENIALYLYDELADDARHELEGHTERCGDCAAELNAMRAFHGTMSEAPQLEVTPNLLTAARIQLAEALETVPQRRGWRWTLDPMALLRQVRFSPALAAVIFMVGFGGGIGTMYRMSASLHGSANSVEQQQEASVAGIRNIVQEPGSNRVRIDYERALPETIKGSVNDPQIQALLVMASRSTANSGLRMDSVDLLRQKPDDPAVRESLVYSLRSDSNPGVRLKAEEALAPMVKQDIRVRNAMLESLLNDNNPGVRAGALKALEAVPDDTSVRQALTQLAKEDPNEFVRQESSRVLAQADVQ